MQGDNLVSQQIRPLTKTTTSGELYSRPAPVEKQIAELLNLARSEFLARLRIQESESNRYLLDEVLVYFVREAKRADNDELIGQIFEEIFLRMAKITMGSWSKTLEHADRDDLHQKIGYKFLQQVLDLESDIGDYAQVRFGDYVSKLAAADRKRTFKAMKKAGKNIELDKPPIDGHAFELKLERLSIEDILVLREGFSALPEMTRRALNLIEEGWQIESKDPDQPTITRHLGVTSRTIRNWINDARTQLGGYRGLGS